VTAGGPADAAVSAAIKGEVRCRFSLSPEAFAGVVLERAASRHPDRDPLDYITHLYLDDLYLADACCRGEDEAWRECRERYFGYLHDFAKRFVHERSAADVADQVIADLWQRGRLAQYDGRSSLKTWLGTVVAHAAINAGKVERRIAALDTGSSEPPALAIDTVEDEETRRLFATLVRRALDELDAENRVLLLLYYEQGLTLDEIAGTLGGSKATLSRRFKQLRQELREAIEVRAQEELRVDAGTLRERLDFGRLEFDLAAALGGGAMEGTRDGTV
jgi:RNA polymerase sigma-70 factor